MLEKEFEVESKKIVTYRKENPGADKFYFSHANGFSGKVYNCLLYTSPSPRDMWTSRMPSSA